MPEKKILNYEIRDIIELNLSFIPFMAAGGLFIPTEENYALGELLTVNLTLPGRKEPLIIDGKITWYTPRNSLHYVLPGIGIQFVGENAGAIRSEIEKNLDSSMEVGGYVYGITEGKRS